MAWTAPATAVTGDIIPAAFWNTYGRDDLLYLKAFADSLASFDSGEVSIASGLSTGVAHGLGVRPRVVEGFWHTASGTPDSKTLPVYKAQTGIAGEVNITAVDATDIYYYNGTGATAYANFYALT